MSGSVRIASKLNIADLEETSKTIKDLIAINTEVSTNPQRQAKVLMLLLWKSNANNGRDCRLSFEAEQQLVAPFLKTYYPKPTVVATVNYLDS